MSADVGIATVPTLEGWVIDQYRGLVTAHAVAGTGLFSDFAAGLSDVFGGRSHSYQKQLETLQDEVIATLRNKARRVGADWVLGVRVDYSEISGKNMQMFMVSAQGTAVSAHRALTGLDTDRALAGMTVSVGDLRTAMLKREAVANALDGKLHLHDPNSWQSIAALVEALPSVVEFLSKNSDMPESGEYVKRASEYFDSLPVAHLQAGLYSLLDERADLHLTLIVTIRRLNLVDLSWILAQLTDGEFQVRRTALQLLAANPSRYTAEDLGVMRAILDALLRAFPDRAPRVERRASLIGRATAERWICGCKQEHVLGQARCHDCTQDVRGLREAGFSPEAASEKLRGEVQVLESLLATAT